MSDSYQQNYKKQYREQNKIVSFPLKNIFYDELHKRSIYYDLSTNSYAKHIVTNFLNQGSVSLLTNESKSYLDEYIRISRGIATNINQIAHKINLGDYVDVRILINSLKYYEDEFRKFITKS